MGKRAHNHHPHQQHPQNGHPHMQQGGQIPAPPGLPHELMSQQHPVEHRQLPLTINFDHPQLAGRDPNQRFDPRMQRPIDSPFHAPMGQRVQGHPLDHPSQSPFHGPGAPGQPHPADAQLQAQMRQGQQPLHPADPRNQRPNQQFIQEHQARQAQAQAG